MELEQICTICQRSLAYNFFGKSSHTKKGITHQCSECKSSQAAIYYADNLDKVREQKRNYKRKRKNEINAAWRERVKNDPSFRAQLREGVLKCRYGITIQDYDTMLENQGGKCAICRRERLGKRKLCVDHDHATGKVRGLLCTVCNSALGFIESPRYERALEYLKRF